MDAASLVTPEHLSVLSSEIVRTLGEAREEIDALNVFPVPDGDTGTNLFLTFDEAHDGLEAFRKQHPDVGTGEVALAYKKALLLAARGNSGVIMSQLFGAMLRRLADPGTTHLPSALAASMVEATDAAYAAVGTPVEGTILSVARAASLAATQAAAAERATLTGVIRATTARAYEALELTPGQLPQLRAAGVVDAGGRGLVVVLEAIETGLTGKRPATRRYARKQLPTPAEVPSDDLTEGGPAYEVMYLLDADDDRVPRLREALMPLGDSLVVVGGDGLWNVHVHVDDVGAAVEAGLETGRPYRIRVTHFAEQVASRTREVRNGRAVVEVAFGDGLAEVFRQAGAHVLTANTQQRPNSTALYEAILATGAAEVVVLPNARDIAVAADAAARRADETGDVQVAVVPSYSQVQGLAALAVHDPGRSFNADLIEMIAAASHARSGAITIADKKAITMGGPCEPGDVLGVVEGDFAIVGSDRFEVAKGVLDKMLGGGGELVTVVAGAGAGDLAGQCVDYLTETYATVDVVEYEGGQHRYILLFGVE